MLVDGKDVSSNWIGTIKAQGVDALASFNPALHPRNPETGKFVERPFNIPNELTSSVDNVSELSAEEIVEAADIPENVAIDGFDSTTTPEINQPENATEAAKRIADAIINEHNTNPNTPERREPPERDNLVDVWSDRLEGGFEGTDEEMKEAIAVAKDQNQNNDEFRELVEQTQVSTEAIHINPENANYDRLAEGAQAERKGDVSLVYAPELGTKSTDPVEPTPGDSVSSKDVATILRHEAAHSMWDKIPREDRKWFSVNGINDEITENLTGYASTNAEEAFAELIAITTHPKFDADNYPNEVIELKEEIVDRMVTAN